MATVLLEALAAAARRMGVDRFQADILAENGPMLRVLADLGLPVVHTREGSGVRIEVGLRPDEPYELAAEERHRTAAAASLQPVFRPRSVAVIGAGRAPGSVGRAVLRSLRDGGFPGPVHAVNPAAEEIEGFPCVPSVQALPEPAELAVIAVPATAVGEVVTDCGRAGVRALLVLSGGLAEVPGLPELVRDLVARHGMRLVGPNSVGVVTPGEPAQLNASFAGQHPSPGDIGLVAQSGGIVIAAVAAWQRLGLGLSSAAAIGDAYDVGARDVLAWFDEDPATQLVVLYAESEPDLRGLARTAAHLAARVPVLALESATSGAGARAAASHTARAATPHAVREAAYASAGIQSLPDLTSLAATAALLRGQPLPGIGPVAILTNLGGGGVLTADACVAAGLSVEPLPVELQERLRAVLPPLAAVSNPVDAGATVPADAFAAALRCLLDSPHVAAVMTVTAPTGVNDPAPGVAAGAAAHAATGGTTPVIDVRLGRTTGVERVPLAATSDRFVTSVAEPVTAARAMGAAMRRAAWLALPREIPEAPAGVDVLAARRVVTGVLGRAPQGDWLLPDEVSALCAAAALPMVRVHPVTTAREAAAVAKELGVPVAVKGLVRGVVHKADAGLLRLPLGEPTEVGRTVREWQQAAGGAWLGAVVQPMVPPGDEFLVGAVRDAAAGPVVAVGPGGRAADALGHRVHRLAPVAAGDVDGMLAATGLFRTAHGRSLDLAGVGDCVRRVAWLADAVPEVAEIDVNPLVVTGSESRALDVRIRLAPYAG